MSELVGMLSAYLPLQSVSLVAIQLKMHSHSNNAMLASKYGGLYGFSRDKRYYSKYWSFFLKKEQAILFHAGWNGFIHSKTTLLLFIRLDLECANTWYRKLFLSIQTNKSKDTRKKLFNFNSSTYFPFKAAENHIHKPKSASQTVCCESFSFRLSLFGILHSMIALKAKGEALALITSTTNPYELSTEYKESLLLVCFRISLQSLGYALKLRHTSYTDIERKVE